MLQEDIELLTDFKNESLEHINETEPLFLRIEQTEGEAQKEIVNAIFRAVHRVKGAAGFFDLGIIQNLAHASENLLMKVRDGELAISRGLDVWGLPENVVAAAEYHHNPDDCPAEFRLYAQVVDLADWISDHQGYGLAMEGPLGPFRESAWHDIGIPIEEIPCVIENFARAAETSEVLLSLADAPD